MAMLFGMVQSLGGARVILGGQLSAYCEPVMRQLTANPGDWKDLNPRNPALPPNYGYAP